MNYFLQCPSGNKGKNLFINNFELLKHRENINMCSMCSIFLGDSFYSVCFTSGKWNVKEVCQFQTFH